MCASLKPCKNGASCSNTDTGYSCQCEPGFTGTNCENDVDECATNNPCQNGAPCHNTQGGYSCACPNNYKGKHCEIDVDECATTNPCQNGAPCHNTQGGYSCACPNTYKGKHCEIGKGPPEKYRALNGRCSERVPPVSCLSFQLCFNDKAFAFCDGATYVIGRAQNLQWSVSTDGKDIATYPDGDKTYCGDKKRKTKIKMVCGNNFKLIKVEEPVSCEYNLEVEAKEACDK